ncbi:MAG: Uma2 family endonuclease [Gammaproteobacteria bacterium]|nr:Uma2 family endonuclease [Gammaproteobacteria bacterium]
MIGVLGLASSKTSLVKKPQRRRLTVDDFARMCEAGILSADDRVELIDGELVEMPPMGSEHAGIVNELANVLPGLLDPAVRLRVQSSVQLTRYTQPEPDLAVVSRDSRLYLRRHPQPEEILIAIEVADSSLTYDREEKMPRYAAAGVPEAWLVNVRARTITVYTEATTTGYRASRTLQWTQELVATAVDDLRLTFEEILPSAYFP